jgi:hypothetical protein
MTRARINHIAGLVPVACSLAAFALVVFALVAGWQTHQADEGAAAHLFQLLMVAQLPFIAAFILTADWRRMATPAGMLALQGAAIVLALSPVALFHL